jgi:hypothetical protein
MYESFGLIGIQLPEKYKENFDVSSEGASTCAVSVLWGFGGQVVSALAFHL